MARTRRARWARRLLAAAGTLGLGGALGCSGGDALPLCDREMEAATEPDAACAEDPGVSATLDRLEERLSTVAGGTGLQVLFGADGGVASVCAERSPGMAGFRERMRVADQLRDLPPLPPGPACLAGTRVALNRLGARLAEVEARILRCRRDAQATREQQAGFVTSPRLGNELRDCLDHEQREAGELWVFDRSWTRALPFVPAREDASRRVAIRRCADDDVEILRSEFAETLAVKRPSEELVDCLAGEGWVPYH